MADQEQLADRESDTRYASRRRPFIGLRPFTFQDAPFFFGREEQIDALEDRLLNGQMISVVGSSGSGKSSLVRAGLMHRLVSTPRFGAEGWDWVWMRPGEAPIRNLAEALARLRNPSEVPDDELLAEARADRIELELLDSSFGIRDALNLMGNREGRQLVILVDQFEEIFRFADLREKRRVDARAAAEQRDEATQFIHLLLMAADDHELPAKIVLTMRSDFIGECARFHGLSEAVTASQYLVPALSRDQRAVAIRGPVEAAGGSIDPILVQVLLNKTSEDLDQLPLLQHTMMRCWLRAVSRADGNAHLTIDDYEGIGGMEEALANHADEVLDSLTRRDVDSEKDAALPLEFVAKRLFQCLTDTDNQRRIIRRPQTLDALTRILVVDDPPDAELGRARAAVREVVAKFSDPDCSFLRAQSSDRISGTTVIDIGHEALIRRWERLGGESADAWAREEGRDGQTFHDLVRQADFGGILGEAQLSEHLEWWERRKPNRAWASRYSRDGADRLDDARSVLDRSQEKIERERAELKAAEVAAVWRKRSYGLAAIACAVVLLFVFKIFVIDARQAAAERLRRAAEQQAAQAEHETARTEQQKAQLVSALAMQAMRLQDPHTALLIAQEGLRNALGENGKAHAGSDVPELYVVAYGALQQMQEKSITRIGENFMALAFDKDDQIVTFSKGTLRILNRNALVDPSGAANPDAQDRIDISTLPYASNIERSEDGNLVLVGNSTQTYVVNPENHSDPQQLMIAHEPVGVGSMSSDGKLVLTVRRGDDPMLWRCSPTIEKLCAESLPYSPVNDQDHIEGTAVAISADKDHAYLAVGAADGKITIFSSGDFKRIQILEDTNSTAPGSAVLMLTFNRQNPHILLAAYQEGPRLYRWGDGNATIKLDGGASAFRVVFSPDGTTIAAPALGHRTIDIWRSEDNWRSEFARTYKIAPTSRIRSGDEAFYQLAFNSEGRLAAGSSIGNIWLWDTGPAPLSRDLAGVAAAQVAPEPETEHVTSSGTTVARAGDGKHYLLQSGTNSAALSGEIKTPSKTDWEWAARRSAEAKPDEWKAHHIALSRDGRWLALTPEKGPILLYDLSRADPGDPSRADGNPIAAFGQLDAKWNKPAEFANDQDAIVATPEGSEPIGWRYFKSPTDLIKFGSRNLPLRIDISGNSAHSCQVGLPSSVREEMEGNFWPALERIANFTGSGTAPAADPCPRDAAPSAVPDGNRPPVTHATPPATSAAGR